MCSIFTALLVPWYFFHAVGENIHPVHRQTIVPHEKISREAHIHAILEVPWVVRRSGKYRIGSFVADQESSVQLATAKADGQMRSDQITTHDGEKKNTCKH